MYVNIGQNYVIDDDDVIGFFDIDEITVTARAREYRARAEKDKKVILAAEDLPKSFLVTEKNEVILSQLTLQTLQKRTSNPLKI